MDFLKKYIFQRIFNEFGNKDHLLDYDSFVKATKKYWNIQMSIDTNEAIQAIKDGFSYSEIPTTNKKIIIQKELDNAIR